MFVDHDDVFMRYFFQNLEGDMKKWFRELHLALIDSWQALESTFTKQWGEKREILYYLT
jgi:hypothetical protein